LKRIAIVPNTIKEVWPEKTRNIIDTLHALQVEVLAPMDCRELLQDSRQVRFVSREEMLQQAEVLISLGGDGTLMRAAKYAAVWNIPVFGINLGHLGYLVETDLQECQEYLRQVVEGNYILDQRMMLEVRVFRDSHPVAETLVLNDAFMAKSAVGRMTAIEVRFDGIKMHTYEGDGVIVATPTGSTAYSLSAGGPVLEPQSENLLVTPICPHSLSCRTIVMSSQRTIQLRAAQGEATLVCDGEIFWNILPEDVVQIHKSDSYLSLIRVKNRSFYDILREKLSERGE
jgi:NAD+ kinase